MFKKFLSLLLAVMMVVSVMAVGVVTSTAATTDGFVPEANKIYFDTDGTGWDMSQTKYKIAFYFAGGDFDTDANPTKPIAWGGKKAIGTATAGETGVFEIDPVDKLGYTLTPGVQYKLIFVRADGNNWKEQTYDLFFTTDCLGHIAHSDGTMTENPVDSSKNALTAYWDDSIDPTENGPVKAITSIGNVVGSCIEGGKTDYDLLKEFFTEEREDFQNKTSYQNAHGYVCEISETSPNYKTEQKLIDDIGAGLGLTKDDVTSCSAEGSYDEVVYCTECGEEISRETKTIDKLAHTPGEAVQENVVPATCTAEGSYDEVVYCTECGEELSRETKTIDMVKHTIKIKPGKAATTEEDGWKTHFYCTECNKLFTNASGTTETTWEEVRIPRIVTGKLGDIDGDGVVTILDVTMIQRVLADVQTADDTMKKLGDVDGDGNLTITDATKLQRWLLGLNQDMKIGEDV